jgi:hypothetical protein
MTTESESPVFPETYLSKARQLLDDAGIDDSSRTLFFSILESYLEDGSDNLSLPSESAAVWAKVLGFVVKLIEKTPVSPPVSPRTPRSASERISELIRLTPRQPFQDRVLGSPVKRSPKEDGGTEAEAPTFSGEEIEGGEKGKPELVPVELTLSEFELLQQKKKEKLEAQSRVKESSEFKIDEVISLSEGD